MWLQKLLKCYFQKQNKMPTIALGLSGGVDSAVAAHLLKQQGYDVTAVRFPCLGGSSCQAKQDQRDAEQIAKQLNIPLQQLTLPEELPQQIINYFIQGYRQGLTPNPDVKCNKLIKFGYFYQWAMTQGFDYMATGHYAQVVKQEPASSSRSAAKFYLATSADAGKDQTYFLHQITNQHLPRLKFPLGHLQKKQVRGIAKQLNLPVASKPDSTGLCFVCNLSPRQYLQQKLECQPGEVVAANGQVIGKHQGLSLYTIGQRRGFTVNKKLIAKRTNWLSTQPDLPPLFVKAKQVETNQLVVAPKSELYTKQFLIQKPHFINLELESKLLNTRQTEPDHKSSHRRQISLQVRIRHTGRFVACRLQPKPRVDSQLSSKDLPASPCSQDSVQKSKQVRPQLWQVTTKQPVFAPAPGQFAVFYTPATEILAAQQQSTQPEQKTPADQAEKAATRVCLGGGEITQAFASSDAQRDGRGDGQP